MGSFKDSKEMLYIAITFAVFALIFYSLSLIFVTPHTEDEQKLQRQLESSEIEIFQTLYNNNFLGGEKVEELIANLDIIKSNRKQADEIWNTIPYGRVLKRGSIMDGAYARVVDLREQADWLERPTIKEIRKIVKSEGHRLLLHDQWRTRWEDHETINNNLTKIHKSHFIYYYTFLGKITKIIHSALEILTGLCLGGAIWTGILFISDLFRD